MNVKNFRTNVQSSNTIIFITFIKRLNQKLLYKQNSNYRKVRNITEYMYKDDLS